MPKIIENVKEHLLEEANRQIIEQGYARTTIRSVASACGLATGTVYNYFKSKDMLIASFVAEDWYRAFNNIKSTCADSVKELFKCIYDDLRAFAKKHEKLFSDPDAKKVFYSEFSQWHTVLCGQISKIISPLLKEEDRVTPFISNFLAEALLRMTVEGEKFENIYKILGRIV